METWDDAGEEYAFQRPYMNSREYHRALYTICYLDEETLSDPEIFTGHNDQPSFSPGSVEQPFSIQTHKQSSIHPYAATKSRTKIYAKARLKSEVPQASQTKQSILSEETDEITDVHGSNEWSAEHDNNHLAVYDKATSSVLTNEKALSPIPQFKISTRFGMLDWVRQFVKKFAYYKGT